MKKIELTQGQFALVDDCDFEELSKFKWYAHFNKDTQSFYAKRNFRAKTIYMHREIMNASKGEFVDHVFHDTLDNRKSKLRVATQSQNQFNKRKQKNNTSGVIGVSFDRVRSKWKARVAFNKKEMFLGYFKSREDAIKARKEAEVKYFGKYAYNNK